MRSRIKYPWKHSTLYYEYPNSWTWELLSSGPESKFVRESVQLCPLSRPPYSAIERCRKCPCLRLPRFKFWVVSVLFVFLLLQSLPPCYFPKFRLFVFVLNLRPEIVCFSVFLELRAGCTLQPMWWRCRSTNIASNGAWASTAFQTRSEDKKRK